MTTAVAISPENKRGWEVASCSAYRSYNHPSHHRVNVMTAHISNMKSPVQVNITQEKQSPAVLGCYRRANCSKEVLL